ncbi:squalene/phytoene synthase family protein [Caenispirillum bisanense]|uniref:squalene/phytoene synthase family protein n=1 Tax=Caenispirillum bisanense TaxID=414052 RepID=UPI0031E27572
MADPARADRTPPLSLVGEEVRRHDRDRFTTALFAPADRREDLFAVYAFNAEVAAIREKVHEPMIGFMRLQWWRDTLASVYDGGTVAAGHPVAAALAEAIRRRDLRPEDFEAVLQGREQDMDDDPPADRAALLAYARATGGAVQRLAVGVLTGGGAAEKGREDAAEAAEAVGTAWTLVWLLRAAAFHAAQNRVYLPRADLAAHGQGPEVVTAGVPHAAVAAVAERLAGEAAAQLTAARARRRQVPRAALPALLPALLAEGYLRRLRRHRWNVFHPEMAAIDTRPLRLTVASLTGRF